MNMAFTPTNENMNYTGFDIQPVKPNTPSELKKVMEYATEAKIKELGVKMEQALMSSDITRPTDFAKQYEKDRLRCVEWSRMNDWEQENKLKMTCHICYPHAQLFVTCECAAWKMCSRVWYNYVHPNCHAVEQYNRKLERVKDISRQTEDDIKLLKLTIAHAKWILLHPEESPAAKRKVNNEKVAWDRYVTRMMAQDPNKLAERKVNREAQAVKNKQKMKAVREQVAYNTGEKKRKNRRRRKKVKKL